MDGNSRFCFSNYETNYNFTTKKIKKHNFSNIEHSFSFKVGKLLGEPFILFKNSECSNVTCPANGGCTSSWISTVGDIHERYDVYDQSVSITCKGLFI